MISTAVLSRWQATTKHSARWTSALYVVVALVYGAFLISTIPGVRPHAGYNVFLDGFLNNIAYELSAVVCFVRARNARSYRRSWNWLGAGLALYGAGNIFWTLFIRTAGSGAVPLVR